MVVETKGGRNLPLLYHNEDRWSGSRGRRSPTKLIVIVADAGWGEELAPSGGNDLEIPGEGPAEGTKLTHYKYKYVLKLLQQGAETDRQTLPATSLLGARVSTSSSEAVLC